jgi:hypothetical protein
MNIDNRKFSELRISIFVILILITLNSCNRNNYTLTEYVQMKAAFTRTNYNIPNGDFTIQLPKGCIINLESEPDENLLYVLNVYSDSDINSNLQAMIIYKVFEPNGVTSGVLDSILNISYNKVNNLKLLEKSTIQINNQTAQIIYLAYMNNNDIIQKEIDIFIPASNNEYYFIGILCENNAQADNTFVKYLDCVETFKLNEKQITK